MNDNERISGPLRVYLQCTYCGKFPCECNKLSDEEIITSIKQAPDKATRFRTAVLNALRCYDAAIAQDSGPLTRKRAAGSLAADLRIALKESKE